MKVTEDIPVGWFAPSVASLTVYRIGSVSTVAVAAPPPEIDTVKFCVGKKFLPLLITSIDVIVPAALTFAENSGRIPSGPNGSGRLLLPLSITVIIGCAPAF